MTAETTNPENPENLELTEAINTSEENSATTPVKPPDSYVKLAMRNMVRKRGQSLKHFFLSTVGLLVLFVGLAYLTR
jgi:Protein of unknown function (DUF3285)